MNAMYMIIGITFFILGFGCGEISSTEKIIKTIAGFYTCFYYIKNTFYMI